MRAWMCILVGLTAPICWAQPLPVTVPRARDTGGDHWLELKAGENLSANRDLTFLLGDTSRTLTLSGSASLNQDLLSTSTPTFTGMVLSSQAEDAAFVEYRPQDYGVEYPDQGTMGGWVIASVEGSAGVTYGAKGPSGQRRDRAFFQGVNINPLTGGRVNLDEPGYLCNRIETCYWTDVGGGTFNLTGAPVHDAGFSTVTSATANKFTANMVDLCWVQFATTNNQYKITGWTNGTTVTVEGDASTESTTGAKITGHSIETFPAVFISLANEEYRIDNANFYRHNDRILRTMRGTEFSFRSPADTVYFGHDGTALSVNLGDLHIANNNRYLYGRTSNGSVATVVGMNAVSRTWLGSIISTGCQLAKGVLTGANDNSGSGTNPETVVVGKGVNVTGAENGILKLLGSTSNNINVVTLTTGTQHAAIEFATGEHRWGTGATFAGLDTNLKRAAADTLATDDDFALTTLGKTLKIKEGTNAKMGTATLSAGASTVATTAVTASSRIFLTSQVDGGTPGWLRVSARNAAQDFTITSSSGADTSTVAWVILEPTP